MAQYSLKTILSTFSDKSGKKLTVFNALPMGGVSSRTIKLFIFSLPFVEYGIIFNPYVFHILGLATSIVTYIVFMSIIIFIIFFTIFKTRKNVITKVSPFWKEYFKDVKLELLLSSGITPYNNFFQYYSKILEKNPSEEKLYSELLLAFKEMEEENKDLILAMNRDNKNI